MSLRTVMLVGCLLLMSTVALAGEQIELEQVAVEITNRSILANVLKVNLSDPRVGVRVALGEDRVGGTEDLLHLAQRHGAVAASNGTFFNAYVEGSIKDPVGTVITGGELVYRGNTGTVFGITRDKRVRMEPVRFKIIGATDGSYKWPRNWYAYWINRTATSANHAGIYTPARGPRMGVAGGVSVIVQGGTVTGIDSGEQPIPEDGYVINFQGSEASLGERFAIGTTVEYRVTFADDKPLAGFWAEVAEALGVGPKLVTGGEISFSTESAKAEGFTEAKILSSSYGRSALGITAAGELLLVTTGAVTVAELAQLMQSLGAVEAMNMDGGASSGLVYQGKYITEPGRPISNALLIFVN